MTDEKNAGIRHRNLRGRVIPEINHDLKVTLTPRNKFVLCIPCDRKHTRVAKWTSDPCQQQQRSSCIAMDPGTRFFMTGYDVDADAVVEVGKQTELLRSVEANIRRADALKAEAQKTVSAQQKEETRNRYVRLYYRSKNRVADLHRKLASALVCNYQTVIVGDWCASNEKTKKEAGRKLSRTTNRLMRVWAHGAFKARLQQRSIGEDSLVIIQNERYTSKTCTRCAFIKRDLGAAKTFTCDSCDLIIDRDVNAALNIHKRFIYEQ